MHHPLAYHTRLLRRDRPDGIEHGVVRMQAQHHRGEQGVVERATPIFGGQRAKRQCTGAAGHRRALVRRLDLHVAAQERPVDQIVGAARVRQPGRELRMNRGAVQALIVILQDQLPVCLHVVLDPADRPQQRQVVAREASRERREPLCGGRRLGIEIYKQESFPLGERDGVEWIRLLVEPFHLVHVRRADQAAVECVRPGVIRALDRFGQPARGRFAQPRAAMAADVVVGAPLSRLVAQHDDAFAGDLNEEVIARRRERGVPADADPMPAEDSLLLFHEHVRRRVIGSRKRACTLTIGLDRFQERHRISRAALRPAAPGIPPPGCVPEPHKYSPSMGVR